MYRKHHILIKNLKKKKTRDLNSTINDYLLASNKQNDDSSLLSQNSLIKEIKNPILKKQAKNIILSTNKLNKQPKKQNRTPKKKKESTLGSILKSKISNKSKKRKHKTNLFSKFMNDYLDNLDLKQKRSKRKVLKCHKKKFQPLMDNKTENHSIF